MIWLNTWDAFVKTVESGSMAAAARRMDCSRAHVSKRLAELEQALGVRLLERTTRKLSLTPGGEVFYGHALRVLDGIREAEQALQNTVASPRGVLRISASVSFGRLHVAPLLPRIAEAYPLIQCELVLNDRITDLLEEKFDLALRLTDVPPENLVVRKLAPVRRVICASPAYLASWGTPTQPEDLRHHQCFAYAQARTESHWRLSGPAGEVSIPVRARFQINNVDSIQEAVLEGHGLAILPTYLCGKHLASGRLIPVLEDFELRTSLGQYVYACYPPSRVQLPRLEVVLGMLGQYLSPVPPWERSDGQG